MDSIQRLKEVDVRVPFLHPKHLEVLALDFKESKKYTDQSSFEFPPKSIEKVVTLFLDRKYNLLNFFDIVGLLYRLEQDELSSLITDKNQFTQFLQELFNFTHRQVYVKNSILKIVTKIFLNTENNNSFKKYLSENMTSKEFMFIKLCIDKDFKAIQKIINNKSFIGELKRLNIDKILADRDILYSDMLLMQLYGITIREATIDCYKNNLLLKNNKPDMYKKIDRLIILIEKKQNNNDDLLNEILLDKLGNIEDRSSNWHRLAVPNHIQERYKRLKGLFEFKRFEKIADYLADNSNVINGTADETRLRSRSAFWSNYDEKFSSVKMWLSEVDYDDIEFTGYYNLDDIKILKNMNNEACMLEFKDSNILFIIFFISGNEKSLIIEDELIYRAKDILFHEDFNYEVYLQLLKYAKYELNEKIYIWQGWVDKYLRSRGVYPNDLIYKGNHKFKGTSRSDIYPPNLGLDESRKLALKKNIEENKTAKYASLYENAIRKII